MRSHINALMMWWYLQLFVNMIITIQPYLYTQQNIIIIKKKVSKALSLNSDVDKQEQGVTSLA